MSNWRKVKLEEITTLITKGTTPTTYGYDFVEEGINFLKIENLNNDNNLLKITPECHEKLKRSQLEENDILFSIAGSLGNTYIVKKDILPCNINQALAIIRLKDNVDRNYINYFLNGPTITKVINGLKTVGAQPNLSLKQVGGFNIDLPSLKEQQKIAEILSSVDAAIEKTEQVIAKTEEVKKGLMQQLLTKGIGHTEFKESILGSVPLLWNLSKLSDISFKINDGAHHTPVYTESGVNFLRVTDIKGDTIDWKNTKFISRDEHEVLIKRCNPELGDILLSKNGTIGQVKLIDFDKEFSIFVSLCLIKPNHDLIYNKFLAYYLQTDIVMKQFLKRSKSGTVTNLHLEEIRQVTVPIPLYEEQLEIVKKIDSIHNLLDKEMKRYGQLKQIKKGLMQQLLTGQVRVKID